jgi:hypothetical protein
VNILTVKRKKKNMLGECVLGQRDPEGANRFVTKEHTLGEHVLRRKGSGANELTCRAKICQGANRLLANGNEGKCTQGQTHLRANEHTTDNLSEPIPNQKKYLFSSILGWKILKATYSCPENQGSKLSFQPASQAGLIDCNFYQSAEKLFSPPHIRKIMKK